MKIQNLHKGARLGILGGTFNPIHNAHIAIAKAAKDSFDLDKVIFVPNYVSPHKTSQVMPSSKRIELLEVALKDLDGFEISTFEIDNERVSFTIETMSAFRDIYKDCELFFIIGDDSLVKLHTWKRIDELLKICRFITISRPPKYFSETCVTPNFSETINKQLLADRVEACNLEISSTEIRECVRRGESIKHLVPAAVDDYIRENGLYLS